MTGLAIVIPRGGSGPVVMPDSMLTAGSLMLVDPSHSFNPWASGVPSAPVVNLAASQAAAMGIAGSTSAIIANTLTTPANGKAERTAKGGLYGLITAANAPLVGEGLAIGIPENVSNYILANSSHDFFFSLWMRIVRPRTDTTGTTRSPYLAYTNSTSDLVNLLALINTVSIAPSTGIAIPRLGARGDAVVNTLGDVLANVGTNAFNGTPPATGAVAVRHLFRVGRPVANTGAGGVGAFADQPSVAGASSAIFYRAYVEDLTVSGRSYAAVDALDVAAHDAAFAPGGRYYGDTYTAASSIA